MDFYCSFLFFRLWQYRNTIKASNSKAFLFLNTHFLNLFVLLYWGRCFMRRRIFKIAGTTVDVASTLYTIALTRWWCFVKLNNFSIFVHERKIMASPANFATIFIRRYALFMSIKNTGFWVMIKCVWVIITLAYISTCLFVLSFLTHCLRFHVT